MAPVDRAELVRDWADALAQVIYIARSREEIERGLTTALDELVHAWTAEPFKPAPAAAIARRPAVLGLTTAQCVECSVQGLVAGVPKRTEPDGVAEAEVKLARVLGAMARGFSQGMRRRLFDEQEGLTLALIRARENAERAAGG